MNAPLAIMVRPWGGKLGDPINFDQFKRRVQAAGFTVLDVKWNDSANTIKNTRTLMLGETSRQLHMIGVSCGANALAYLQNELKKLHIDVDYAAAVQPSTWCQSFWMGKITDNVKEELVIYSGCIRTLGFGCYKPQLTIMPALASPDKSLYDGKQRIGNAGRTKISWKYIGDLHPGDWNVGTQNIILQDMIRISRNVNAAQASEHTIQLMMKVE